MHNGVPVSNSQGAIWSFTSLTVCTGSSALAGVAMLIGRTTAADSEAVVTTILRRLRFT